MEYKIKDMQNIQIIWLINCQGVSVVYYELGPKTV